MDLVSYRAEVVVYVELNFVIHIPKKKQFLKIKIKKYIVELNLFIHIPKKKFLEKKRCIKEKILVHFVPNLGPDLMNLS